MKTSLEFRDDDDVKFPFFRVDQRRKLFSCSLSLLSLLSWKSQGRLSFQKSLQIFSHFPGVALFSFSLDQDLRNKKGEKKKGKDFFPEMRWESVFAANPVPFFFFLFHVSKKKENLENEDPEMERRRFLKTFFYSDQELFQRRNFIPDMLGERKRKNSQVRVLR